jgi:hypothetical protein
MAMDILILKLLEAKGILKTVEMALKATFYPIHSQLVKVLKNSF